jgi:hypothetical protein
MRARPLSIALFSMGVFLSSTASAVGYPPSINDFTAHFTPEQLACLSAQIANKDAFLSAMPVVYGSPKSFSCDEIAKWKELAASPGLNMAEEFKTGMNFVQAVKFLRYDLAKSNNATNRVQVVRDAIATVYGREPTGPEMVTLQQQIAANQGWYAGIVSTETKKLNNDKAVRHDVIDRAYLKGMGRKATAADQSTWISRPEHFTLLVEAIRSYLYSPAGADDLKQTVTRALAPASERGGRPNRMLTQKEIDAAIAKFTPEKRIFADMK